MDNNSGSEDENPEEAPQTLEEQMIVLRKELSEVPFEELQKIQDKVGTKAYNAAIFSKHETKTTKKTFKRENKNRPMEMTSKRQVSRFREIVPVKKGLARDPRFDDLSGQYDEDIFTKRYDFLDEMRTKEKQEITRSLKKAKKKGKIDRVKELQSLLSRMKNQEDNRKVNAARRKKKQEIKMKERELVKQGKKPFYLKKSEIRKMELAEKFSVLKKRGKLDKYLERKRKKKFPRREKNSLEKDKKILLDKTNMGLL